MRLLQAAILALITTSTVKTQNLRVRSFNIDQGLCHRFIYCISQSPDGYLWLGTGEGICRFDGLSFTNTFSGDTIPVMPVTSCFTDSAGILWFGTNDGTIFAYKNKCITRVKRISTMNSSIASIQSMPGAGAKIIILSQNGGLALISEKKVEYIKHKIGDLFLNTFLPVSQDKVILADNEGIYLYNLSDTNSKPARLTALKDIPVSVLYKDRHGNIWAGTTSNGIYQLNINNTTVTATKTDFGYNWDGVMIRDILVDKRDEVWISTYGHGLIVFRKMPDGHYMAVVSDESMGFQSNYIRTVFQDTENNLWVGSFGQGLMMVNAEPFTYYTLPSNNILSLASHNAALWCGTISGLYYYPEGLTAVSTPKIFLAGKPVTALYYLKEKEILLAGTENDGVFGILMSTGKIAQYHRSTNNIENTIKKITGFNNKIYIGTLNGVFEYDINTKEKKHYTTMDGVPHNNINDIFCTTKGGIFFATRGNELHSINFNHRTIDHTTELIFHSITQDRNGDLWGATYGSGVFIFTKDSLVMLNSTNGLKSDYCYSAISDPHNHIWIGHRLGLSRISENKIIKTFGTDIGFNGDCNLNSAVIWQNKKIYWGTTTGLVAYDLEQADTVAAIPKINITQILINDSIYDISSDNIRLPYGIYRLNIGYTGIFFRSPAQIKYQYMLEGFDLVWSEKTTEKQVRYPRLEDGYYTFKVKAYNPDGFTSDEMAMITIRIDSPFWKRWWFILICIILFIGSIHSVYLIREQRQKAFRKELERQLDERTAEVVSQKEEIELKNKDITASINYASRIQQGMLPPYSLLEKYFPESFIINLPRDIVSGDFYWFDKIDNDNFIIVCADCTGHGVPGSMVSMIGMTLIKDIILTNPTLKPSEIMYKLDTVFQETINQNIEKMHMADGMDLTISKINLKTHELVVSAAMRAFIITDQNGAVIYKGDKYSIGGTRLINERKKDFTDKTIQLNKKDCIYFFSDGLQSQFNYINSEKFQLYRIKNLITNNFMFPMIQQKQAFLDAYQNWKGDMKQTDDINIIGIRL